MSTKSNTPSATTAELDAYQAGYRAALKASQEKGSTLTREPGYVSNMWMVRCPCCGDSEYLHHNLVDVFEREEDAEICRQTTVTSAETLIRKTNGQGNPSARRNGLNIFMWCEQCGAESALSLSQHKGNTFLTHSCVEASDDVGVPL